MLDKFESDVSKTGFRNFELCNGTIDAFVFPPLDFVTCSLSLHHTGNISGSLERILNVLKPGGRLFVVEKSELSAEIQPQLKDAGFVDIVREPLSSMAVETPDGRPVTMERDFYSAIRPSK
jgi:ubiquinone/menaquinone biosynthesis C-methylase UbiE